MTDDEFAAARARLRATVRAHGYEYRAEPFRLASGEMSHDFVDGKRALANGADLELACRLMVEEARRAGVDFDAAGGLTMGADQFAHGIAIVAGCEWFVVRKEPKGRGTNKLVEGTPIAGRRVLLVEDVATTGGSMGRAFDAVVAAGAVVAGATMLVDRGDRAAVLMADKGVWYRPLLTYHDLGIVPVGDAGS